MLGSWHGLHAYQQRVGLDGRGIVPASAAGAIVVLAVLELDEEVASARIARQCDRPTARDLARLNLLLRGIEQTDVGEHLVVEARGPDAEHTAFCRWNTEAIEVGIAHRE